MPLATQYLAAPPIDTQRLDTLGSRVAAAIGFLGTASAAVAASRGVTWVSHAGAAYRGRIDETLRYLAGDADFLEKMLDRLRAMARRTWTCAPGASPMSYVAGNWVSSTQPPRWTCSTGGGTAVTVGGAVTSVDPEALSRAATLLDDAVGALGSAQAQLNTYVGWHPRASVHDKDLDWVCLNIGEAFASPTAPGRQGRDVSRLAGATRDAAREYAAGEARAQGFWRGMVGTLGRAVALPAATTQLVGRVGKLVGEILGPLIAGEPLGEVASRELREALAELVEDGGVEGAVSALTDLFRPWVLRAAELGMEVTGDPTVDTARLLCLALGPAAAVTVTAVKDSPHLSAPRGAGDLLDDVAASDSLIGADGLAAPPATVTILREPHAGGPTTWVVALPGTQAFAFGGPNTMDWETNLQLTAGVPDSMTDGVKQAMAQAGIPPDEQVVLAGHSQGGMVATNVAAELAAEGFAIAGVVTAGSPSIWRASAPGVPTVRFEHVQDAVPRLDGRPVLVDEDTSVVRREMDDTLSSHWIGNYQETAHLADAALVDEPGSNPKLLEISTVLAADDVTEVTTLQFQVIRKPVDAAAPGGGGW